MTMQISEYITTVRKGIRPAMMRLAFKEMPVSFLLVTAKRSSSYRVRLKARITRIPLIFSRRIWLTLSTSFCILEYMGMMTAIRAPMITSRTGMIHRAIFSTSGLVRKAITSPPTSMMGMGTSDLSVDSTISCTRLISLVVRVTSEDTPILSISLWDRCDTFPKIKLRRVMEYPTEVFVEK